MHRTWQSPSAGRIAANSGAWLGGSSRILSLGSPLPCFAPLRPWRAVPLPTFATAITGLASSVRPARIDRLGLCSMVRTGEHLREEKFDRSQILKSKAAGASTKLAEPDLFHPRAIKDPRGGHQGNHFEARTRRGPGRCTMRAGASVRMARPADMPERRAERVNSARPPLAPQHHAQQNRRLRSQCRRSGPVDSAPGRRSPRRPRRTGHETEPGLSGASAYRIAGS